MNMQNNLQRPSWTTHFCSDSVHLESVLQLCSLGYRRVPSRSLCGFASAVVEALIRIGYGLIRNKNRNGSQMNRKAKTRRETPTFSAWEAGVKETLRLPQMASS